MNEEDEAFEDLAKRQGDWGMQGSRKHQIMRYAENVENKGTNMTDKEAMKLALEALETLMLERGSIYEQAITALKARLAQPEPVELPCCGYTDASAVKWNPFNGVVQCHNCGQTYTTPPKRTEQNFCSRCGKRTNDIHTCTPPKENT
jgi:membrane protease subunit (stomatin/prohibitin family)